MEAGKTPFPGDRCSLGVENEEYALVTAITPFQLLLFSAFKFQTVHTNLGSCLALFKSKEKFEAGAVFIENIEMMESTFISRLLFSYETNGFLDK